MNHRYATPARQFPIRLDATLSDRLDEVSRQTHVNKTTLSRIALTKFLTELDETGIPKAMNQACQAIK